MKPQNEPIHICAKKEDIADIVIFPGDPLRAEYIAKNFLEKYNDIALLADLMGHESIETYP